MRTTTNISQIFLKYLKDEIRILIINVYNTNGICIILIKITTIIENNTVNKITSIKPNMFLNIKYYVEKMSLLPFGFFFITTVYIRFFVDVYDYQ